MDDFDVSEVYLEFLNGGVPVDEWIEIQEWAAAILTPERN